MAGINKMYKIDKCQKIGFDADQHLMDKYFDSLVPGMALFREGTSKGLNP